MPEQHGPEQVGEGGILSEIALVRSAFHNRLASESRAVQMELQAAQIREVAKDEHEGKWKVAKTAMKDAAETGELAGRDLLEAVIDLRAITPAPRMPQRKPVSLVGKHGSIMQQTAPKVCPPLNKEGILAKFDAIKPGEPIIAYDKVGTIQSESTVALTDRHWVLGAYVHTDVAFSEGLEMDLDISVEYNLDELIVGRSDIQAYLNGLNYTAEGHGRVTRAELKHNLEKLKSIRQQVSVHEGFNFDFTHLDEQIAAGEWSQARIREHREHRSLLQRALDPRW